MIFLSVNLGLLVKLQECSCTSSALCKAAWGIGNRFCLSLVIITRHLIASVAFKSCCLNPQKTGSYS